MGRRLRDGRGHPRQRRRDAPAPRPPRHPRPPPHRPGRADQASSSGAERLAAFTAARGADATTVLLPSFTTDAGRTAGRRIAEQRDGIDAVVCGADVLAVGLVSTLQRSAVSVPGEIAVTGFDDTEILELLDPPITSIRHPLAAMAERTLALLPSPARERTEDVERFAPQLVVRASADANA
ncbi:substrate-binding domain-containing protein [Kitasatospora sp. NPDC004615]|uniref:substrate-binding domain-containing protein n=1 Tax=Kitasatospora sp. NPDC004615 TaxID=3364017 RepID=UPI00368EDBF6